MNPYTKNLSRIEFVVTYACTGRCRHCSEGDHASSGAHIDGDIAAASVKQIAGAYDIRSLMTFGGEPLLYPDAVYAIHAAARDCGIAKRQVITNGYFSRDSSRIRETAARLADCGVNDLLLSVDAFHQETIPIEPVAEFARAVIDAGVPIRLNPAWLVSREADNPYNRRTRELAWEFASIGAANGEGNVIFPEGNARKNLAEYFTGEPPANPYAESPDDVRTISVDPDGSVLSGNLYRGDILEIIASYRP